MLRTLLLLLALLSAAPLPAQPACHAPVQTAHEHGRSHAPKHREADVAPPHACLGCVPPGDWLAARIAAPALAPAAMPSSGVATLDLGDAPPPLLRPPRLG